MVQGGGDALDHLGEDGLGRGEVEPEGSRAAVTEGGPVHDRDVRAIGDELAGDDHAADDLGVNVVRVLDALEVRGAPA